MIIRIAFSYFFQVGKKGR